MDEILVHADHRNTLRRLAGPDDFGEVSVHQQ